MINVMELTEKDRDIPIDKGWAWVIVAGAFCLFALQSGGFKSQGIILLELIEKYEGVYSPSQLLWVFSLKFALGSILAPLVGFLIIKSSHRVVAAAGLILDMVGYLGLAYCTTLPAMLLSYSVIAGIGEEMMYLTPLLVSGSYFRKRKALALGIIASGSGFGYAIISYLLRFLFDNYSFGGACMLYGGFTLNFLIPVCLFRPISFYSERGANSLKKIKESDSSVKSGDQVLKVECEDYERQRSASFSHVESKYQVESSAFLSASNFPTSAVQESAISKSIKNISRSETLLRFKKSSSSPAVETRQEKFLWRVIILPRFILVLISSTFFIFGGFIVFQFLPALGKESGLSKETVTIAMMIGGVVEVPCRILNGHLADLKLVTITTQYALSMLVPGFFCLICASISGLAGISLALAGMSLIGTSVFSILPVVIGEMVGQDYVTSGMSIQLFFACISFGCTTYISGAIFDAFGSWKIIYFYIAAMMLLASTVVWPYCLWRWCSQKCSRSSTENTNQTVTKLTAD
ncbi:monocarboxylate transporter 14-like [Watersipora subatra]|uniref:monocarboxylate transporter 14-like n=1 Tax=Watersipora subatra TaxID=2589382 RepID=UPI00355AF1D1